MNLSDSLRTWIDSNLSSPVSFLGNLPPCPFAREALLNNKIEIRASDSAHIERDLISSLEHFPNNTKSEMTILAVEDWQNCDAERVQNLVSHLRERYFVKDLWLLYDHPSLPEVIDGFSLNHGNLLLFMIQKLSRLVRASHELHKQGYYKNWPQEYFAEVVEHRQKYYNRLLASTSNVGTLP